jgi:para-nitrobenzyl esterase
VYRFDWHPPGSPLGACHCIELPFVFGTLPAWREAPMLAGAAPADLVRSTQSAWSAFARDGRLRREHESAGGAVSYGECPPHR